MINVAYLEELIVREVDFFKPNNSHSDFSFFDELGIRLKKIGFHMPQILNFRQAIDDVFNTAKIDFVEFDHKAGLVVTVRAYLHKILKKLT